MAAQLRKAVQETNWADLHASGKTKFLVEPSWVASEERCEVLRRLCKKYEAKRVLEVGACCGLASLAMAEVMPEDGEVIALEIDPYFAEFGRQFFDMCEYGRKIKYTIGPAMESLKKIARACFDGKMEPFDFLLIDADRAGLMDYFNMFWWESPNMLADQATVCIDITPYKGQVPMLTRGPSAGDLKGDLWVVPSGQDHIDSLRRTLEASAEHDVYKVAGLLVSHSKEHKKGGSGSNVSTPRRSTAGSPWKPMGSGKQSSSGSPSLTHGYNPLASFPNEHFRHVGGVRWVPPQPSDPVAELRNKVKEADWGTLYADEKTMTRVDKEWCGTEERCALLRKLVSSVKAASILEIGGFCGISALSMAEELPDNGQITSLELDPFLVDFGKESRQKSVVGHKMQCLVGPAMASLESLARNAKEMSADSHPGRRQGLPYDFVVVDADRDGMGDYFRMVWDTPGLLKQGATVCIDVQPYKGQAPVRFVKHGKAPEAAQWIVPTGQDKVDALLKMLENSARFSFYKVGGLLVVNETGMSELAI